MQKDDFLSQRWRKTSIALFLAVIGAILLTKTIFYDNAPVMRPDIFIKAAVFNQRLLDKITELRFFSQNSQKSDEPTRLPPPWSFKPSYIFPTTGLIYPTEEAYPTFDPNKKITPSSPKVTPEWPDNQIVYPSPTSKPIFNPPTAPPPQPPASPPSVMAADLLTLINNQRGKEGAGMISFNSSLNQAAQKHAETTGGCGHYGPDGSSPFDRVINAGYPTSAVGENIACGADSAQRAFDLWMNSSGHHANMVNKSWRSAGIGIARGYWVFVGGPI